MQRYSILAGTRRLSRGTIDPGIAMEAIGMCEARRAAAIALYQFTSTFIKIHGTLLCTPAIAASFTNKPWEVSDLVTVWEEYERVGERAA